MKNSNSEFIFIKDSIADKSLIDQVFEDERPAVVVNLAAQAGVRYSISNLKVYIESNLKKDRQLRYSIMVIVNDILHILMIL